MRFYGPRFLTFEDYIIIRPSDLRESGKVLFYCFNVNKKDESFGEYCILKLDSGQYLFRYETNVSSVCLELFWSESVFKCFLKQLYSITRSWSCYNNCLARMDMSYSLIVAKPTHLDVVLTDIYPDNYSLFIKLLNGYFRKKPSDIVPKMLFKKWIFNLLFNL